jgi:FkbM family methyltransferase
MKKYIQLLKSLYKYSHKEYRFKCFSNFIRWQIGSRVLSSQFILNWIDGSKLIIKNGDTGLTGNIYFGLSEFSDMMFLLHTLQKKEIFIDIGANLGSYTVLSSKVIGSKTICFEPVLSSYERLKDKIIINEISDLVVLQNKGVGNKNEYLNFTNNHDTMNKVDLSGANDFTTKVEVINIDSIVEKNKEYFIKIDVEGFEFNVLKGAFNTLKLEEISAIIIEINGSSNLYGSSNELIHNFLLTLNFFPVSYNPFKKKLKKLNSYSKNTGNTIYIKNYDITLSKIKLSKKYYIKPLDIYL